MVYVVHMSDIQQCSLDDLEKYMREAKEDIRSNDGRIDRWVIHGDSNAFRANKQLTKPFAKAAGIPRPELRWIAAVIAGDEGVLPYPQNRAINPNSGIYKTLADVLREGNDMTRERIGLISRMAEAPVVMIRGNSEPGYSLWALFGHHDLVEKGELEPVEEVIRREARKSNIIRYLEDEVICSEFRGGDGLGPAYPLIVQYSIPWADSKLLEMIAEYSGVSLPLIVQEEKTRMEKIRQKVDYKLRREPLGDIITINMHGAPTKELSAAALMYKGENGKDVEQEALVDLIFRRLSERIGEYRDVNVRVLYGHDGVEVFVDQMAELHGVPFRGIHLVEEGPAHYENLLSGEITMSSSAKAKHNETVRKYDAMQRQNESKK